MSEENKKSVKRIAWIDTAKGIGIILVILYHISSTAGYEPVRKFFALAFMSFCVVAFYMLSGFTAKPKNINRLDFIKSSFVSFIIPIYILGIPFTLLKQFYRPDPFNTIVSELLYLKGSPFYIVRPAWFIFTLFFTVLIFRLFSLDKLKTKYKVILIILGLSVGYLFTLFRVSHIFGLFRLPISLSFYLLGNISYPLYKTFAKNKHKHIIAFVLFLLSLAGAVVFNMFLNKQVYYLTGDYGNYLYFLLGALFGSYVLFYISYKMRHINFLIEFGRNTLFLLIVQKILYWNWKYLFKSLLPENIYYLSFILCFLIILIFTNPLCRYLNIHCPVLVGKLKKRS